MAKKDLTPLQQKRVTIIKDAIAQLKTEKYIAESSHGYVELDGENNDVDDITTLERAFTILGGDTKKLETKKFIDKLVSKDKPCTVCARGALCISGIRKVNNLSLQAVADAGGINDVAADYTAKLFGRNNAVLVERWFEHDSLYGWDEATYTGQDKFYLKYPDATDRLIVIFQNMIANKGTFKPNKLKLD